MTLAVLRFGDWVRRWLCLSAVGRSSLAATGFTMMAAVVGDNGQLGGVGLAAPPYLVLGRPGFDRTFLHMAQWKYKK